MGARSSACSGRWPTSAAAPRRSVRWSPSSPAWVGLEDALAILLALLDREPATFSRAAARWGSRLVLERKLTLDDAQLTLAALEVLPSAGGRAGAEPLIELSDRHGLRRVDELLGGWMRRRGLGD